MRARIEKGSASAHEHLPCMQSERSLSPRFGEFIALGPTGFTQIGYAAWGTEAAERTVVCVHGRCSAQPEWATLRTSASTPDSGTDTLCPVHGHCACTFT